MRKIIWLLCFSNYLFGQNTIWVNKNNSIESAIVKAKKLKGKTNIHVATGTYYLKKPLVINDLQVNIIGHGQVKLSGSQRHRLNWTKHNDHIFKASLHLEYIPDALFIGGEQKVLARYPNFDPQSRIFNGTDSLATSKERVKSWQNPVGGYLHALHGGEWGSFHYKITGKDSEGNLQLEGGWQNNRPWKLSKNKRFVENIFEELDAPNEWFYDKSQQVLYYYPANEAELKSGFVELSFLKNLIKIENCSNVSISNINFGKTQRTLFDPHEPLLRSDWKFNRNGAVVVENSENVKIDNCTFTQLGSHAILATGYNKNLIFSNNHIFNIGQSAICFVGNVSAVRSPSFAYEAFVPYHKLDLSPGPKNNQFPQNCIVSNNLIHHIGQVEKQATGVEISMSQNITVKNNTIYNTPRAGINIGDGTWGGHVIEYNEVFNTVMETGDHGAFNSWGRDRFWQADWKKVDSLVLQRPEMALLDAKKTTIIRNNRFRCDHGWDIDLDDGSSNYHVYNNICLNGGLKLREGLYRVVENNIMVNNTFHPHVWFHNSQDVFRKNIVTRNYYPILVEKWGKEVDFNLFPNEKSMKIAQTEYLTDAHSLYGNPQFVDANKGNYNLLPSSPAFKLGFKNINTKNIGVQNQKLKKMAQKVEFVPLVLANESKNPNQTFIFLNAELRDIIGLGDKSAYGLPSVEGAVVVNINAENKIVTGLQPRDVIVEAEGSNVANTFDLINIYQKVNWTGKMNVIIYRNQQKMPLVLLLK